MINFLLFIFFEPISSGRPHSGPRGQARAGDGHPIHKHTQCDLHHASIGAEPKSPHTIKKENRMALES